MTEPASETAEFILARARACYGARHRQARRARPLTSAETSAALRFFAEYHVAGVRAVEAHALADWSLSPERALLFRSELSPAEIVKLQAKGQRCVSLIDEASPKEGLAFALHDLRHLGKFFDPAHHLAQRGFFRCVSGALSSPSWHTLDSMLDARWQEDRDAVLADMNGSAVFLFSALKMRLRMAARRRIELPQGVRPPIEREEAEFRALLEMCLDGLGLSGDVRAAAEVISCRRDAAPHARKFIEHFEALAN